MSPGWKLPRPMRTTSSAESWKFLRDLPRATRQLRHPPRAFHRRKSSRGSRPARRCACWVKISYLGVAARMVRANSVSRKEFAKFAGARWNAMNDICALSDIKDLTPVQRVAHLCYWYMSEVYNGGHYQYFVNKRAYDHMEFIS